MTSSGSFYKQNGIALNRITERASECSDEAYGIKNTSKDAVRTKAGQKKILENFPGHAKKFSF